LIFIGEKETVAMMTTTVTMLQAATSLLCSPQVALSRAHLLLPWRPRRKLKLRKKCIATRQQRCRRRRLGLAGKLVRDAGASQTPVRLASWRAAAAAATAAGRH